VPAKTKFVKEVEPGVGLYKKNPEDPDEEGMLRYLPGNPQGKQPGTALNLGPWLIPFDSETARQASLIGQKKKQEAIERGIRRGVEEEMEERGHKVSLATNADALEYIAIAQTKLAMAPDQGMPAVKAAELMFKATDAMPDPRYQLQQNNTQINLIVDSGQLDKFRGQIEYLDAEFTERKDEG
jgi:hypothetical protein